MVTQEIRSVAGLPPGISVEAGVLKPCKGCGEPTKVRFNGEPYQFRCVPPEAVAAYEQRPAGAEEKLRLRFLEDLHDRFGPKKRKWDDAIGKHRLRNPYWMAPMPPITDLVQTSSWSWRREGVDPEQAFAILDRTAAFLSAASSVDVAHGALVHNPEAAVYQGLPGFYKVVWHPWEETAIEHPLGPWPRHVEGDRVLWVPHTRAALLHRLATAGRYPDGFILDAYTCAVGEDGKPDRTDLKKWAAHVRDRREQVIAKYGRYDQGRPDGQTLEYKAVKTNFSQAVTMMTGSWAPGKSRIFNPTCRVRRTDWGLAISDLSAVILWGWCDDARQVVTDLGHPELAPVAMRNMDEIVVPAAAVDLLTTTPRSGGRRPLTVDPAGITLGTFKVKKAA